MFIVVNVHSQTEPNASIPILFHFGHENRSLCSSKWMRNCLPLFGIFFVVCFLCVCAFHISGIANGRQNEASMLNYVVDKCRLFYVIYIGVVRLCSNWKWNRFDTSLSSLLCWPYFFQMQFWLKTFGFAPSPAIFFSHWSRVNQRPTVSYQWKRFCHHNKHRTSRSKWAHFDDKFLVCRRVLCLIAWRIDVQMTMSRRWRDEIFKHTKCSLLNRNSIDSA